LSPTLSGSLEPTRTLQFGLLWNAVLTLIKQTTANQLSREAFAPERGETLGPWKRLVYSRSAEETDHFKDKPKIMRATSRSFLVESIVLGASGLVHGNLNILVSRLPAMQASKGTRILTVL
jgi:hypothetical protein